MRHIQGDVVYSAENSVRAHLLKRLLENAGINAEVAYEALQGDSERPPRWGRPCVVVPSHHLPAARQLAEEFELQCANLETPSSPADQVGPLAWPRCPECQHGRTAVCPICETTGNDFALVEDAAGPTPEQASEGAEEPLSSEAGRDSSPAAGLVAICPTCDEPIEPGFLRRCQACGHDFEEGLEPLEPEPPLEPRPGRVVLLSAVLLLIVLGMLAWFALLVR